jgi:hypothetical protein
MKRRTTPHATATIGTMQGSNDFRIGTNPPQPFVDRGVAAFTADDYFLLFSFSLQPHVAGVVLVVDMK